MKLVERLRAYGRISRQTGAVSLVEVGIVLLATAIMVAMMVPKNDADNTKGTALLSNAKTLADAFVRAKNAMGCYPSLPAVLWSGAQATAANLFCGIDGTQVWDGPYVDAQPTDTANGSIKMASVAPSVRAIIAREATPATGLGTYYFLHVNGVPNGVVLAALQKCNGSKDTTATFSAGNCRGTLGSGGTELGTFDYKIEETAS